MTTTYTPTQTASFATTLVDPTTNPLPSDLTNSTAALFRFQLPTDLYFLHTLSLDVTFIGTFGGMGGTNTSETFNVVMLTDPDAISTLTYGNLDLSLCPEPAYLFGTAAYAELGSVTLTTYGAASFNLDLAIVTRIMSASTSPTNTWNGSLLLWVVAEQDSGLGGLSTIATLTAYDTITYTNRDTGSRGINSSRWTRCPVSGLKVPRGEMVLDGYRNILVASDSYDPPEPESLEWDDFNEPNEDM